MLVRLNAPEFMPILRKNLSCSIDEIFSYVQPKDRTPGLASIKRFQKGWH
jgi:hypothetical protein